MRRAHAIATAFVVCVSAAAFGLASCTEETTATADLTCSTEAPILEIVSPADGACVAVSSERDVAYVPVIVRAQHFKLVPPGGCNGCVNCGHLALFVNGKPHKTSVTSIVDIVFKGEVASLFTDLEVTAKLVDDDGNPWQPPVDAGADSGTTIAGSVLTATVKITTAPSCDGASSSSSSSSGSSSSSSSASSSGTGGAGGGMTSSSSTSASSSGTGGAASSSSSSGAGGAG